MTVNFPPVAPVFVVTRITPLAALAPYMAAEEASFSTEIDATSFGSISLKELVGIPSTKISASVLAPNEPTPRICMVLFAAPG
ncbi:hypothetical protein D3C81_1021990 [compost metagenome]